MENETGHLVDNGWSTGIPGMYVCIRIFVNFNFSSFFDHISSYAVVRAILAETKYQVPRHRHRKAVRNLWSVSLDQGCAIPQIFHVTYR